MSPEAARIAEEYEQMLVERNRGSLDEEYTVEDWEELREMFAQRREEIENDPDYSDMEREQAVYDLELEYEDVQSQHNQQQELGQDIGQDHDQGMEH